MNKPEQINSIRDLNLHDSELMDVIIKMDDVIMHIDYIEDYETMRCCQRSLIFRECSQVSFKINSGYAPPDSILVADETVSEHGRKIRIEMNTSATVIEIVAQKIEML
jgi:hypothetical protein